MRWEFAETTGGQSHVGFTDGEMLRNMSDEGWELVSVVKLSDSNAGGEPHFYFKRPKVEGAEQAAKLRQLATNVSWEMGEMLRKIALKIERGESL